MTPQVNKTSSHPLISIQRTWISRNVYMFSSNVAVILTLAFLFASFTTISKVAIADESAQSFKSSHPKQANFKQEQASYEVRYLAEWIVDSKDKPIDAMLQPILASSPCDFRFLLQYNARQTVTIKWLSSHDPN